MGTETGTSLLPVTRDSTRSRASGTQAAARQGHSGQGSWDAGTGWTPSSVSTATGAQALMSGTIQVVAVSGREAGRGRRSPGSWEEKSQMGPRFQKEDITSLQYVCKEETLPLSSRSSTKGRVPESTLSRALSEAGRWGALKPGPSPKDAPLRWPHFTTFLPGIQYQTQADGWRPQQWTFISVQLWSRSSGADEGPSSPTRPRKHTKEGSSTVSKKGKVFLITHDKLLKKYLFFFQANRNKFLIKLTQSPSSFNTHRATS